MKASLSWFTLREAGEGGEGGEVVRRRPRSAVLMAPPLLLIKLP